MLFVFWVVFDAGLCCVFMLFVVRLYVVMRDLTVHRFFCFLLGSVVVVFLGLCPPTTIKLLSTMSTG